MVILSNGIWCSFEIAKNAHFHHILTKWVFRILLRELHYAKFSIIIFKNANGFDLRQLINISS